MASKSTNDNKGSHETLREHPVVPRTPGERGNKLLVDAQRVAKGPFGNGQVDCFLKVLGTSHA